MAPICQHVVFSYSNFYGKGTNRHRTLGFCRNICSRFHRIYSVCLPQRFTSIKISLPQCMADIVAYRGHLFCDLFSKQMDLNLNSQP